MTYIVHMMGGRDIEMEDDEHSKLQQAVKDKVGAIVRKSNGEILTLSTISSSEKVIEPPKYEASAVDDFMERNRKGKKENNQKPYGSC
jgi:hypothetical protein